MRGAVKLYPEGRCLDIVPTDAFDGEIEKKSVVEE
jgi:hypothetical protein